ncbi:MAG: flagellin FliC [Gammaproteobacteria bacterium]|nr:flagellin FliC [Gammaproteobacteria bacterium]
MGVVINTNISSITASRILSENRADLEKAMERLASGKRINSANDDAAGMAVAAKMRADIRSLNQAVRNTNDAISLVNTYDGAASEIESILIRMRELAVQANNGTYEAADRTNADYEYTALKNEITRIAGVSAFNRTTLGQGSGGVVAGTTLNKDTTFSFYVGSDVAKTGNTVTFSSQPLDLNLAVSAATLNSIVNTASAAQAILNLDDAIYELAANRAQAGALVNRLEHTVSNLMNVSQRLQEAVSGIEDADYAAESAALARGMVLAQAGTAMLAQANQAPNFILALLRG